jgi:UDP-glucose 4-epimerase
MKSDFIIGITGGLGLIGKALRLKLSTPVVLLARNVVDDILGSNEKYVIGNFSDPEVANKFVLDLDILIHAASSVGPRSEFSNEIIRDDLVGTIHLAQAFFKKNPKGHFIYLSTAGGLYDLEDVGEKIEESELVPKSLYGAIKLIVEDALVEICGMQGMVTILRPSAVYGDPFKKNQTVGLIDKLLKSTLVETTNSAVTIFDKMDSARDYLHIDDLAKAIKALINRESESQFEIYNVGTGKEASIGGVIKTINSLSEGKVRVEILPTSNKRTSLIVNSNKIFNDVGWKSEISLRDGILKMYQDLKNKELI